MPDGHSGDAADPACWRPGLASGGITVLIGGQPAARVGDMAICVGPPDSIAMGSPTVLIGNMMAARWATPPFTEGRSRSASHGDDRQARPGHRPFGWPPEEPPFCESLKH